MNQYLFLDVDGVLNNRDTYKKKKRKFQNLDEENLRVLKEMVDEFQLQIVLSTSWRISEYNLDPLKDAFLMLQIPLWISVTPVLYANRGIEIETWMKSNSVTKEAVVILDDRTDMGPLKERLIQTDFMQGGLKKEHLEIMRKLCINAIKTSE